LTIGNSLSSYPVKSKKNFSSPLSPDLFSSQDIRHINAARSLPLVLFPFCPILAGGYDRAQVMPGEHPPWPQVFLDKPYRQKELKEAIWKALAGKNK